MPSQQQVPFWPGDLWQSWGGGEILVLHFCRNEVWGKNETRIQQISCQIAIFDNCATKLQKIASPVWKNAGPGPVLRIFKPGYKIWGELVLQVVLSTIHTATYCRGRGKTYCRGKTQDAMHWHWHMLQFIPDTTIIYGGWNQLTRAENKT